MESLQRVKLGGFEIVIVELEVELDYLRRATRYLEVAFQCSLAAPC
jgi:hypothetical protein